MKMKIDKEKLKSSIIMCLLMLIFDILFSILTFLLIWYWAIPNICTVFPTLKANMESLIDEALSAAFYTVYATSAYIAILPSAIVSCRLPKKRKKDFFDYSKGRIPYIEGMKYYVTQYGVYDAVCVLIITLVSAMLYGFLGDTLIANLFPTAYYIFESIGIVLGVVVALLLIALSILCGVFFSQKKWRAEYFFGE